MKRLNVIYLQQKGSAPLWNEVITSMIGEHHDVHVYDPAQPAGEQFQGMDAVVDMGGASACQELVDAATGAKLWQIVTVGYDFFDLDMLRRAGIPVCHCPGSTSSAGLAEAAVMFMLMIVHHYNEAQETLGRGQLYLPMGDEVEDKVLGLIGFGASAKALANFAKPLGMRLMIVEPREIEPELLAEFQPEYVGTPAAMDRIFCDADFISLHLPLTPETKGIVTAEKIAMMKPTACFINIARGDLVDQEALYTALLENRIAGIGTDVHAGIHPDPKHPVYQHPQFYAMPHVSGTTRGTVRRRSQACVDNLNHLASDAPLQNRIGQ